MICHKMAIILQLTIDNNRGYTRNSSKNISVCSVHKRKDKV